MKDMKIWMRLNTALALLVLLLLIGVASAIWMLKVRSETQHENDTLESAKQLIDLRMTKMSDALRGVLLDRKDDVAKALLGREKGILSTNMNEVLKSLPDQRPVSVLLKDLINVATMVETNPAGAIEQYQKIDSDIAQNQSGVLDEVD